MLKLAVCLLALVVMAGLATAQPLTYYVQGTYSDGGTFAGSFNYDASTNRYIAVNIVTTPGTVRTVGATYSFVCGQDVPTCTGVIPGPDGYLNLTSTAADQTGMPAMSLFFPAPLSPAPGFGTTGNGLFSLEANCNNAACAAPAAPLRSTPQGVISSSEPLEQYLFFGS